MTRTRLVVPLALVALAFAVPGGARATTLAPPTSYVIDGPSAAIAAGFVDGGMTTDLVSVSASSPRLESLVSVPGGMLSAGDTPSPVPLHDVALADVNLDGKTDGIAAGTGGGTLRLLVFRGQGNGAFHLPDVYAIASVSGSPPADVVVADVDGDGDRDVALTTEALPALYVMLNLGGSTFSSPQTYPTGSSPTDLVVGDFNLDGKRDLVVLAAGPNQLEVFVGTGTGSFFFGYNAPLSAGWPTGATVTDLNNDGKDDVVVGHGVQAGLVRVSTLLQASQGFHAPVVTTAGSGVFGGTSVAAGDLGQDGVIEVAAINPSSGVALLANDGMGALTLSGTHGTGSTPTSGAFGDFSGDARADLAAGNNGSPAIVSVFAGGEPPSEPRLLQVTAGVGRLDLSWSQPTEGDIGGYNVYRGSAPGTETLLASTTDTSYADTGLPEGATYSYYVRAYNAFGEGPASATVTATVLARPTAPQNLTASPGLGVGAIRVTWQPPASDGGTAVTSYELCRATSALGPFFCTDVGAATAFDDTAPLLQTTHYKVRASNAVGAGPYSDVACSKPFPWVAALGC